MEEGGLEEWKNGRMEEGGLDEWKGGRGDWMNGRGDGWKRGLEEWKRGRVEGFVRISDYAEDAALVLNMDLLDKRISEFTGLVDFRLTEHCIIQEIQ